MLIRDLSRLPDHLRGGAVSIGNFDGVHRGHAKLIGQLGAAAAEVGGPALALTFDPHPARILRPETAPVPLCTPEQKAELLAPLGVAATIVYPVTDAFLQWPARTFFHRVLRDDLGARAIVEGPDFRFGHNREGDIDLLGEYCREAGIELWVVAPEEIDGEVISSSRVRAAVAAGRVDEAAHWLTRPYQVTGVVGHGAARGRSLGYPTANLERIATLLPCEGIYAGQAWTAGRAWPAAISLGPNPTFGEGELKIEVYLIGFEGDLYDQPLAVDFLARLRDIVRFTTIDALIDQMDRDVALTRQIAERHQAALV